MRQIIVFVFLWACPCGRVSFSSRRAYGVVAHSQAIIAKSDTASKLSYCCLKFICSMKTSTRFLLNLGLICTK